MTDAGPTGDQAPLGAAEGSGGEAPADAALADAAVDVPELVPVRMLNEATYCPRLFYLEWVQSRWADSADTERGRYEHRVVDQASGRAPGPPEQGELQAARSVMLSSPRLGLVGRIDLLEGKGEEVVPVDYKKGSAPDVPAGAYEPERVQVAALALLLQENGYSCSGGALWFQESRERVDVPLDPGLVESTLVAIERARAVAASSEPPPPLVSSPKCPRCSLVGICLPDEHNALTARSLRPPRRLTPSDKQGRPLYVTEQGASIGWRDSRFEVYRRPNRRAGERRASEDRVASVRAIDVSQICLFGNVQISAQAHRECFAREIPVLWFSYGGWLQGIAEGLPSKHVELRRHQVALSAQGGVAAAKAMVEGKIRNARTLLRRNGRPAPAEVIASLAQLAAAARAADSPASLLGIEGAAARLYFQSLPSMLGSPRSLPGEPFSFSGRNRRPPKDPVNCLLSFVYALLVKDLLAVTLGVGFDPYLGFYHRPRFGRPALALDLAEEFRPLVADSVVVNLINNGEARPSHFVVRAGGVGLTQEGRKAVLAAYERRLDVEVTHPVYGYRINYRRVLEVQARMLAAWVVGEVPEYAPFTTR